MTEFASIKIAAYRHREHSRDGRLHGHCPVLVLSYVEAYTTAQDVVQKHIDALGSSHDQYFDLYVLVPKSVARAKALAKAKRRAKK